MFYGKKQQIIVFSEMEWEDILTLAEDQGVLFLILQGFSSIRKQIPSANWIKWLSKMVSTIVNNESLMMNFYKNVIVLELHFAVSTFPDSSAGTEARRIMEACWQEIQQKQIGDHTKSLMRTIGMTKQRKQLYRELRLFKTDK